MKSELQIAYEEKDCMSIRIYQKTFATNLNEGVFSRLVYMLTMTNGHF